MKNPNGTLSVETRGRGRRRVPPLVAQDRACRLPLSFAQESLWFLDQLGLVGPAYNMLFALNLEGVLQAGALESALSELIRRHESLRTRFPAIDGSPEQVIDAPRRFPLRHADLTQLDDGEQQRRIRELTDEETRRPFDLSTGPLIRALLVKRAEQEHVLLLTVHHIAFDGWSRGVLEAELAALYSAYARGKSPSLPGLTLQYADYAIWQRQWLQGEALEQHLRYWKDRLQGAPPQLELPADRPRPAVESFRGAELSFELSGRLSSALKQLARDERATLFMVCLAAYQLLLSRWTGQQDVVVGSPVAGRSQREVEGLIGFFVNMLVLRTEVSGELTFRQLLQRVKEVTLGAYAHQDLPFETLVRELRPERNLARHPIFQVALTLQSDPEPVLDLPDLSLSWPRPECVITHFDLMLYLRESPDGGLSGVFEYSTDLFDRESIERLAESLRTLLDSAAASADLPVRQLPILSEAERRKVLFEWNGPERTFPQEYCVHEIFERQVMRAPNAVAVQFEGRSLTYAELNRRANQLAHLLRERGLRPDALVGLYIGRGLEMVIGLLAILKSGAAYLPLDPAYPSERIAFTLEDAAPRVILTEQSLRGSLPATSADVFALDQDWPQIARYSSDDLDATAIGLRPEHLAYVIYTSGSTGRPKGVMVEHRNVTRLFAATDEWFRFDERDVWSVFHSFAFDFSVWELWGALLYGGKAILVPHLVARSPREFYHLLCRARVTVLNQTPSAFAQLIDAQSRLEEAHCLRAVVFGGEALELRTLKPWLGRSVNAGTCLINMYGITETTVHVTYHSLAAAEIETGWRSPVGKPIPDLRVYLLDSCQQPVPVGVPGEIYVGGSGVARGYLERPDLTRQRFLPDPFSQRPDARMYRSGDLGRWLPDGTIEYLGRNDQQVKIRGYRIELGEIEVQIASHEAVKDVVVAAREDVPGEKRLVAYVVPKDVQDERVLTVRLRDFLKGRLPDYMMPSAWVLLMALPLTENGKLDRRALPPPPRRSDVGPARPPFRTEHERALARIWSEVLRVDSIGADDNFFDLGGHSLLATRVISRIRDELQVDLPLRALFDSQTIEALARQIGERERSLREQIDGMPSEEIHARIAELERALSGT